MKEQTHLHDAVSVTLREAREYARLSQGELAERAGCARSFISFLETGSHLPGLNAFMALADALGISPSELMRRIEERMAFHKNIHA